MLISSEYVSLGHPDRLADALTSNLITKIQEKDGANSHAAIEVFLTDDTIVFGGEATTSLKINKKLLKKVVEETFEDCGYGKFRRIGFNKKQVRLAKESKILNKIHSQSKDIAMATTDLGENSGFNDQGIFYSGYDSMTPTGQGVAKYLAQSFGEHLFKKSKLNALIGSDIKTIFTIDVDKDLYTPKSINHITVAIPLSDSLKEDKISLVKRYYEEWKTVIYKKHKEFSKDIINLLKISEPEFTVNGTGRYVNHGYAHDTSMCGRKLAVNNMSAGPITCQNQIGGGSYIKPFHASDFLLPMACTWLSRAIVDLGLSKYVNIAMSCSIGQTKPDSICVYGDDKFNKNTKLKNSIVEFISSLDLSPNGLGVKRGWNKYNLYKANKNNFVGDLPWLDTKAITKEMKNFLKLE